MRRGVVCLLVGPLLYASSAAGQSLFPSTGERIPTPRAVEDWQPSANAPAQQVTQRDGAVPYLPQQQRGYDLGDGWRLFPALTAGMLYDDNVFASNSNRRADWVSVVRPEFGVRKTGQNYDVAAQGYIEGRKYFTYSSEDQVNGTAAVAGLVQPDANTQMRGRFRYVHAHEDRGVSESLLFPTFDRPVAYDSVEGSGVLNKRFDRWWTSTGAAGLIIRYQNPTIGGVTQSQSYRNGNVVVGTGRLGYVVAPLTSVFLEAQGNRRDFDVDIFDSRGYRTVIGALLEAGPGARFKGEIFAGYMNQQYTGATFQSVSTWTYGVGLAWLVAPQLTAVFEGRREAKESALAPLGVSCVGGVNCGVSLIESLIGGRFDYQLASNLVVGAGATYLVDEFLGGGRTDRTVSPLFSVKYLLTPAATLGFDYRYLTFNSSGALVPTYYRNVFLLSLHVKM